VGPSVKETILKRKRLSDRQAAERAAQRLLHTGRRRGKKGAEEFVKKAEKFVLEYRNKERFEAKAKRGLRSKKKLPVAATGEDGKGAGPGDKILLVVRVRGNESIPEGVARALRRWRLNAVCDSVFVERSASSLRTLRMVEPFVTYGYPTMKTVNELVYKRGFARVREGDQWKSTPLSDNRMIEDQLGAMGVICTEDLIEELVSVGPHHKQVVSFLQPFKLRRPAENFSKLDKLKPYKDGTGVYGNREDHINTLVATMI